MLLSNSKSGKPLMRRLVPKEPEQPRERMMMGGKTQAVALLLDAILDTTRDRVVVVSRSLVALSLVRDYVSSKVGTVDATISIIGSTPKPQRDRLILKFNDRATIGVSALRVCLLVDKLTEGLTLIGANHLVLMEPSWSPAGDAQALGRVHRPGQPSTCYLYRMLSTGSLEETILDRQAGKTSLLAMITGGDLPAMQSDDRKLLFDLDEVLSARAPHPASGARTTAPCTVVTLALTLTRRHIRTHTQTPTLTRSRSRSRSHEGDGRQRLSQARVVGEDAAASLGEGGGAPAHAA